MSDPANNCAAAERTNHDASPKSRSYRSNLNGRETADATSDAEKRTLEGVAHLHQTKSEQQRNQTAQRLQGHRTKLHTDRSTDSSTIQRTIRKDLCSSKSKRDQTVAHGCYEPFAR